MHKFDSRFSESLGLSYAGCVRDLVRFTAGEVANATNAPLPFFRFFNPEATRNFNALWAGMLEAIGILAAMTESEEYRKNEKLVKKTLFHMHQGVEATLTQKLLSQLTPDAFKRYEEVRKQLIKEAIETDAKKADLADSFLRIVHGEKYDKVSERTKVETLKQVSLSYDVFRRVYYVEVAHFENQPVQDQDNSPKK